MADSPLPADKPTADDHRQALPAGTRFGELEILRTLGIGGFGIVYLARDHALEREVAIKEFMPAHLAWRSADARVSVRASSSYKTFEAGRKSFVNEARLLARFDHRSLLKVYRFWEDNGTAYMAMPYLQGQTLTKARKDMGHAPDEAWILQRLLPLLDALALLHSEGVYHRDIAPDNIWLSASDGAPILLDFGAARREMGDQTQGFTAILKPSYAPIEQYAESNALRQGPWTDLYALGAVLYHLLIGEAPPPATARIVADECQPLAERDTPALKAYSPQLLQAIDWALAVRPKERPANVAAFKAVLTGEAQAPARARWTAPPPERLHPLMNLAPQADPHATTVRQSRTEAEGAAPSSSSGTEDRTTQPDVHNAEAIEAPDRARLAMTLAVAEPVAARGTAAASDSASRPRWQPALLGAGAVLIGAGLLVALARVLGGPGVGKETALAASAPASSAPALAASSSAVAASVPAAMGSSAPAIAMGPTPTALPNAATGVPAARPLPGPGPAASKPVLAPKPTEAKPIAPKPQPAAVATAPPIVSPAAPAESPASAAGMEDPQAACADRSNFLAREFCVARRCERPQFEKHPVCVHLQEVREQRRSLRN
ncbi:serine/threonine protein kinase [Inhella crocodyli]|uniref:non-specific serine/threonine protein kinase n=1 Tax=Inhella crocodyli TaxID=2499851 RepID=A0A3S3TCD4_9BURK|nr:serine/threonine-protein kinase [Inhella crocodyli]RVT87937.1 serine/threonine protein kinase [Inhella crocodyli]